MSTYYYFQCEACERQGGFFSHQAWGWGNCDIVENFKFIAYHATECGHENIRVVSEHDEQFTEEREEFLEATKDIFPFSSDWGILKSKPEDVSCTDHWMKHEKDRLSKDKDL